MVTLGVVILLGWQGILFMQAREPVYQGKKLGEWLELYQDESWDSPERQKAAQAVQNIGPKAIPSLLKTMSYRRPPMEEKGIDLLRRQKLVPIEAVQVGTYRARGADGFEILGEAARPAIPKLVKLLDDRNKHIKYLAFVSLLEVRPSQRDLTPALMKAAKDPDPYIGNEAVNALRYFDPEAARGAGFGGPVDTESYVYIKYEMLHEGGDQGHGVNGRS
ncbi:hypothetical protein Cflav_PD0501 [Pedosphaera parvula Ellin514]|uniref:PBS lyase HEAT domain protein repeat-containing protein n=2 Tax=Pedosphaera TaxID=1032526 RepID=B9XRQ2_PEDPL|nr:hypothetical protein Cflav_PD0501 [Pedosphaera parvula Ellin514]